jgi:hypothetical protein
VNALLNAKSSQKEKSPQLSLRAFYVVVRLAGIEPTTLVRSQVLYPTELQPHSLQL